MNKQTRNTLRNTVTTCRRLLEESIAERLQGQFGLHANGRIEDAAGLTHLSSEEQAFRAQLVVHLEHIEAGGLRREAGKNKKQAPSPQPQVSPETAAQLIREIAFTHLNRFAAYKLMETRGLIRESVSRGVKSQGFLFYLAQHPEDEALWRGGQQDLAYAHFLEWLGGTLSREIGVLFAPTDPANRLLPPQRVLDELLALLNSDDLAGIWDQDETIGWVYQYFTPKELRDQARKESRSPRNSYELSFRNQFYTPRYVVQFLTDNTLGRIWYEMRRGDTALVEQCAYLVRRPNEVFLEAGDLGLEAGDLGQASPQPPASNPQPPTPVPFRLKRDPRELKILDPACGSGHFLLYAFDLLTTIYAEAYDDPQLGQSLQADYPDPAVYRRAVPGLILRHNLHGIDIDPRAIQIASLALWLKAKKSIAVAGESPITHHSSLVTGSLTNDKGQGTNDQITKMNLVTAEPMPGSAALLREFTATLNPPVLGQLVEAVFDKMKLAGEAGTLLKIEEELAETIAAAKQQWLAGPKPEQLTLWDEAAPPETEQLTMFDLTGISDAQFWDEAEGRVLAALQAYAEQAETSSPQRGELEGGDIYLARRLFADDAARGFAFIDLCRQRFDVVLMNPPFGAASKASKAYIDSNYPDSKGDVLANFIERTLDLCQRSGFVGAISSRTCFFLVTFASLREKILTQKGHIEYMADLGDGVLEAMVETAAYILSPRIKQQTASTFYRMLLAQDKGAALLQSINLTGQNKTDDNTFFINPQEFSRLRGSPYAYWVTGETIRRLTSHNRLEGNDGQVRVGLQTGKDARFLRLIWEVPSSNIGSGTGLTNSNSQVLVEQTRRLFREGRRWAFYSKTDIASPWMSPLMLVVDWEKDGDVLKDHIRMRGYSPSKWVQSENLYFRPGFSYMLRSTRLVPYIVPAGVIPTAGRAQVYPETNREVAVLGYCASNIASAVARFNGESFARPKYQASMVQNLPVPAINAAVLTTLDQKIKEEVNARRAVIQGYEPFHEFTIPALLNGAVTASTAWNLLTLLGADLELSIAEAFGLTESQLKELERDILEAVAIRDPSILEENDGDSDTDENEADDTSGLVELVDTSQAAQFEGLLSYCVGVIVTRWDIRLALNPTLAPPLQEPFEPLPVCPPGALVGPDGLPATSGCIVSEEWLRARPNAITLPPAGSVAQPTIPDSAYPLRLDWDGILVDDPDHQDDIVRRVRDVIELLWGAGEQGAGGQGNKVAESQGRRDAETNDQGQMTKDKGQVTPDDIEREACEILGVKALRDYFRKSGKGGFWDDHVKRYSKSRRKAPIYWLLQSSKKNYALWLYYHRLDGDLLYKALVNYVEPKIRLEEGRLDGLRQRLGSEGSALPARERRTLEKSLADQEDFVAELRDFEDKLRRVANLNLTPDLNDGVVLNIAPLWELVPWREAKKYWDRLLAGQYEWSSIGAQLREKGVVEEG